MAEAIAKVKAPATIEAENTTPGEDVTTPAGSSPTPLPPVLPAAVAPAPTVAPVAKPEASAGPMKTIILDRGTVRVPLPGHKPMRRDMLGGVIDGGEHRIGEYPPGQPFTVSALEADRLLARFGGRDVTGTDHTMSHDVKIADS